MNRRSAPRAATQAGAIAVVAWQAGGLLAPARANGHLPADFPNACIAPAGDGRPEAVWREASPAPSMSCPACARARGAARFDTRSLGMRFTPEAGAILATITAHASP